MTASAESVRRQFAAPSGLCEDATHTPAIRSRLPVSVVALLAATGVVVVAAAYTGGRLGFIVSPWGNRVYWLGQALIVVPVTIRMLSRRALTEIEIVTLTVVLTVTEYLSKVCYSPAAFTFADELQHWRGTVNLLHTGNPLSVNYALPISPYYPGLEEATSALISVTGLSVFVAGLVVAGVAHLLFICLLYMIFRDVGRSSRIAGIAVLFYSSNEGFPFFDSMFAYETLAMAFLGLALLAAWRLVAPGAVGGRGGWFTIAVMSIIATVVTHHVTSYILVGTLVLITLASLVTGDHRRAAWPAVLTLISLVAVAGWVVFSAPETIGYLEPVADEVLGGIRAVITGTHSNAPPVSKGPLGNQILAGAAVLTLSALLPVALWRIWSRGRHQPWAVAMAIGSLSWYGIVAVRLVIADGNELAGRAAPFAFVPAALIAAAAVARLVSVSSRRQSSAIVAGAIVGVLVLLFDGLANSWPPYWERLPGSYQVDGSERSVGPEEVAAASWALAALGPGNRFAADFSNSVILGSYGDQNPVNDDAYLYVSNSYTRSDGEKVRTQAISYVLVDRRLSSALPASGQYFADDSEAGRYTHPLALAGLTKFDHVPGVGRLYDSGNIVIYDLEGSEYYAP